MEKLNITDKKGTRRYTSMVPSGQNHRKSRL